MERKGSEGSTIAVKSFEDQARSENANEKRRTQATPNTEGNPVPQLLSDLPSVGSGRVLRFKSGVSSRTQPLMKPELTLQSENAETTFPENSDADVVESESDVESLPADNSCFLNDYESRDVAPSTSVVTIIHKELSSSPENLLNDFDISSNQESDGILCHTEFVIGDSDESYSVSPNEINATNPLSDLPSPPSYELVCKKKSSLLERNPSSATVESVQPPTYRDVVGVGRFIEDAPPNYHTLFSNSVFRMIDFHSDLGGTGDDRPMSFIACVITYCLISVMVLFCACMVFLLPLAMIIIGVTHLHGCPAQPRIPVFLTSMGVFQLLECCGRCSMYIYTKLKTQNQREEVRYKSKDPFVYFIVVWFVVGSMWVYQNYPTCHDVIPKESRPLRGRYEERKIAKVTGNTSVNTTKAALEGHLLNIIGKTSFPLNSQTRPPSNGTISESIDSNNSLTRKFRPTISPITGVNSSLPETVYTKRPSSRQHSTAVKPKSKPKAACCGRVVYFFTFGIVTFYYSIIGLLFLVHICGSFIKLLCRCRSNRGR